MSKYELTAIAQRDLVSIRDYYLEEAGFRTARQMIVEFTQSFKMLARTPGAGHKREDLAEDRPILFWPLRDYLIIYKPATKPLQIITIVRGSQNVPAIIDYRRL